MIIILLGPPYSGKGTQAEILSKKLNLPVFSMGGIIRDAYNQNLPRAREGYENYSLKGLHLPNEIKFPWLKEKLNGLKDFILDNYPATKEDLDYFLKFSRENNLETKKVFMVDISIEEMRKRMIQRGRKDDKPEVVMERRQIQDKDRLAVLNYFQEQGLLVKINGEGTIEEVQARIMEALNDSH